MRDEASVSGLSLSRGRALLLGIRDVNRLDDLAQRHASGRYGFARIQLLQECFHFLHRRQNCRIECASTDFGTLIWPHFGRLIWPHLIYSDRSSYPVPASRDGEGDGQETQGGTV